MDYVKMEAEYNCSKEVKIHLLGMDSMIFYLCHILNVKVLYKLKKGLESENADMNRDVEVEYRDILK